MMSSWHSLSGYLHYKSGNNALGRLITKRRTWCVLEESECKLLLYKTEDEVHKQRHPQGHVNLSGAAISLDLEHQNQFVIISDKKEHVFTADNHESMMIWLIGLQSKREMHHKNNVRTQAVSQMSDDYEAWNNRPNLYMSENDNNTKYAGSRTLSERNKGKKNKIGLQRAAESVDSGFASYKKSLEISKNLPYKNSKHPDLEQCHRMMSVSHTHLHVDSDSDDVFARELEIQRQQKPRLSGHWKKLQYAVLGEVLQSRLPLSDVAGVDRRSASSRSTSSDSAIERGDGTSLELSTRLSELERELISTKCELAKVMNRQTCYQELLIQKDDTIKHLEQKSTVDNIIEDKKSSKQTKNEREFQERIRVLQNQNRFLNEEVKKLARLRLLEHGQIQEQNLRLQKLEGDIEKWKMDYVSLIQSCIRCPGEEGCEDVELCLYGGDKHKKRIQTLLDEARKINPSLPTYHGLMNREVHVDEYGFKHVYTNTGLVLHYLCTELTHHFLIQAGVFEDHQKKWTTFMRQHGKHPLQCRSELKSLCRGGIPDRFRKQIWQHLVHHKVRDLMKIKGDYYYRNICNMLPESPLAACYRKQVSLDLMRTMPNNVKFSTSGSKGVMDLQDVLLAFCIHNPTIGYCQGMNFIAGMSLIFLDPEDAFWMLVAVAESYFSPHYFDHSLIGAQSDQQVLKDLVKDKLPALYNHLESIDIELCTITLNWFLAIFFDAVPFQTLLRIWDCFLLEGPKVLFRFSLSILKLHEKEILQKNDTMGVMKHLKACAKLTYDVEGLVKLSFEGLKPFPKRKSIISKQTCYLNALKEKYKKKELQRLAFAEREQLYMSMEAECGTFLGIECAVATSDGQVWLCYGDQHIGKLSFVSCETGTMFNIDFKLDSRLMCICYMNPNELLLGTISWMLVSVDINKHEQVWQIQLHDAILSVCCYDDEDIAATRIFSGLADGTIAVTEKPYISKEPNVDVLYISIGQAPVTCLMLLDEQLWCASGNTVAVIHGKTLDTMDTFSVSVNPYDHILSLQPCNYGIWISLRGSSILELWDPRTLNCRMLYDTRTDRYPQLRKEDDSYFNRARITSTLANGNTVWIGTGEGNLIIYEILESAQLKTPTELSPSIETTSSLSYVVRPQKQITDKCMDLGQNELSSTLKRVYHLNEPSHYESTAKSDTYSLADTNNCSKDFKPMKNIKNKLMLRRLSSSESDLENLQKSHFHHDSVYQDLLQAPASSGILGRICSENDIDHLEKERNISCDDECYVNHAMEEELEVHLEAEARRESLTKFLDAEIQDKVNIAFENRRHSCGSSGRPHKEGGSLSRRSSFDKKRRSLRRRRMMVSGDLDDSGCESTRGIYSKSKTSCSSSRRSSLSRRGSNDSSKCKILTSNEVNTNVLGEKEDVFEARLEEKARRESLVLNEINLTCLSDVNVQNVSNINQYNEHLNNNVVNIYIDQVEDKAENKLEQLARRQSLLGIELYNLDDSYISSSPNSSCHEFPYENSESELAVDETIDSKAKTTALGMSIDSTDDTELDGCKYNGKQSENQVNGVAYCKKSSLENGMILGKVDDVKVNGEQYGEVFNVSIDDNEADRKSSVDSALDNFRIVCSDCISLKQKCSDCRKLLESQQSLKINEKRLSLSEGRIPSMIKEVKKLNGHKDMSNSEEDVEENGDIDINTYEATNGVCNTDSQVHCTNKLKLKDMKAMKHSALTSDEESPDHVNVFGGEQMDKSDLSRQEKVGIWLKSISNTLSMTDSSLDCPDKLDDQSAVLNTCGQKDTTNSDSGIPVSLENGFMEKESQNGNHSNKSCNDDEDVFYPINENVKIGRYDKISPDRPTSLNLLNRVSGGLHRLSGGRIGSTGSEEGSTQKSGGDTVLNKKDPGTQYRLDFSSVHVETDLDSERTSPNNTIPSDRSFNAHVRYGSSDSRKNSLDLGTIKEKCSRLQSEDTVHHIVDPVNVAIGEKGDNQKMFEFLKTPSLASRQASLGLKIINDDLEWTDLYGAQYTTASPSSTTDQRLADFLRTPSISSRPSSMWSSYENISTPSQIDEGKYLHPMSCKQRKLSHTPSTASIGSDVLYSVDLSLEAKMKISDKPVKCLLSTKYKDEPIILSFSGSYGDDEAVLKWRKHENEQLWTNEPVLEICSKTKMAILPTYMRRRMSSNSSFNSH